MAEFGVPGFYGKIPSRGDFVSRRLPRDFIDAWDGWLQDALAASRAQLGPQWLDVYLTSPVWHFALSAGTCGDSAYAGVLIPSVDRVGRYFPLVAAMPFAGTVSTLTLRRELAAWYERCQDLLLETLDEPALELDVFDRRLAALRCTAPFVELDWTAPDAGAEASGWRFVGPDAYSADGLNAAVLSSLITRDLGAQSVWWTTGSARVGPVSLILPRLPAPEVFASMLDGDFSRNEWSSGALQVPAPEPARLQFVSAAISDPGKVRTVNEDSYACSDALGAWLVADGLGGHQAGEVASGMVASVLDGLPSASTLQSMAERLTQGINVVNGCLRVLAERSPEITIAASTVAALLTRGEEIAVVWAGDSRVYRLRDDRLEQLTRDHVERDASDDPAEQTNHAVTRAVGGAAELELERLLDRARPLDRYLLCTDGLYGTVSLEGLAQALALDDPEHACAELARIALESEATDNLTAIAIYVGRAEADVDGMS